MIIDDLLRDVPSVRHAVLLTPDGLVRHHSPSLDRTTAEYLAPAGAMLRSVAHRVGGLLRAGEAHQVTLSFGAGALVLVGAGPDTLAVTTDGAPEEVLRHLPDQPA